jgi:hypothetical protein
VKAVFLAVLVAVAVLAAACGNPADKHYTLEKTKACLTSHGVRVGGTLDFVATTSTGGAFKAHLGPNFVTIAFGATSGDADNIDDAYRRFRSSNVGIDDVLRQQNNAVMLWHEHPSNEQLATVTGCLE